MSNITLQKGDYVKRADVEQYADKHNLYTIDVWQMIAGKFIQAGCGAGEYLTYIRQPDLTKLGWSMTTNELFWSSGLYDLCRKVNVADILEESIDDDSINTDTDIDASIASIYVSFDTETAEGNPVSYSLMLEDTLHSPLTWMTAMDEFVKVLQQGGYIIDDESLARYFNSKLANEPTDNCGGHF